MWFPDGPENASEQFAGHYDAEVRAALPLAAAKSIDQTAAVLEEAGLRQVTVTPLTAVYDLELQMQYLLTGHA